MVAEPAIEALRVLAPSDLTERLDPLLARAQASWAALALAPVARHDQVARILEVLTDNAHPRRCSRDVCAIGVDEAMAAATAALARVEAPARIAALRGAVSGAWFCDERMLAALIDHLRVLGDVGATDVIIGTALPDFVNVDPSQPDLETALTAWARLAPRETAAALTPLLVPHGTDRAFAARRLLAACGEHGDRALVASRTVVSAP